MVTSKIVFQNGLRTEAQHIKSGKCLQTDAPRDNQGKGQAFSPTDLLATSLVSCMFTIMGIKARDSNWDLNGLYAEMTKQMADKPRRVQRIEVKMYFPDTQVWDNKKKKILEGAAQNCPVAKSLHPDIDQDVHFIYP